MLLTVFCLAAARLEGWHQRGWSESFIYWF